MAELSHLSEEELLFDRQECHNDLAVLAIAKIGGVTQYSGGEIDERISRNLEMIEIIRKECERRGIDPAIYRP